MKRTKTWKSAAISCFLVISILTAGCGDGRPQRVPVSGLVTIDGKRLTAGGSIRLTPQQGRVAQGEIDGAGRFILSTFDPGDGCPLGLHDVTVYSFDEIDEYTRRWNIPKKYHVRGSSGLTATIDGPTDNLHIELTWGGKPGPFVEQ